VVLKDVFEFTLEEIAMILSTTAGAVKAALHRGRSHLAEEPSVSSRACRAPSKELVDRFVAAFNARDLESVTKLLFENTTLDVYGIGAERGTRMEHFRAPTEGEEQRAVGLRVVAVLFHDEWIVVGWAKPASDPVLVSVERFEEEDGHIAHVRSYFFCPETVAEIAGELGAKAWWSPGYTQNPDVQSRLIAAAVLPWGSDTT
jgi:RNA polymerase sigma-70 factor (ECF subfamily)